MTESTFPQYPRLVLSKGREKSLLRRHPWVFSGAVSRLEGKANLGETIDIVDHQGKWLARGAWSPAQKQQWRDWLAKKDGLDSYRLIAGESDGLPGVTIDRFGHFLVLQLLSAGAEYQRAAPHILALCKHAIRIALFTIAATSPCGKKKGWR
ncbi:23S rRNA m(5)C1962 methyltransferase [Salmonella enterica subsp. enterica serovar Cerro str. FSL R8-0235]|nr:23S rRNA m(5)C1962 methyltransferase [Salmonella enterica subsp. enterica serovar Cerro str. FSL R8-0235]